MNRMFIRSVKDITYNDPMRWWMAYDISNGGAIAKLSYLNNCIWWLKDSRQLSGHSGHYQYIAADNLYGKNKQHIY